MSGSRFVYVIYIRATAEQLWDALTKPEFTRTYWAGAWQESEWRVGSSWRAHAPDGRVWDSGEILEADRPRRLVLTWRNEHFPEMRAEGFTKLTYELVAEGGSVRLTVTHESEVKDSKTIEATSGGWPILLCSLKSLLETGEALEETKHWPKDMPGGL